MTGAIARRGDLLGRGQAVEDRHLDVEDDQVGVQLPGQVDGLLPVADLGDDGVALLLEHLLEVEADQGLVLGDEHPDRLVLHGAEPSDPRPAPSRSLRCWRRPHRPPAPVPQRQRERTQNPYSVRSNRTGGTVTWRSSGPHRGRDIAVLRTAPRPGAVPLLR